MGNFHASPGKDQQAPMESSQMAPDPPLPAIPDILLKPPPNGACLLLSKIPADVHLLILGQISSTKDLLTLMQTSKVLLALVQSYIQHTCLTDHRLERVRRILAQGPLLIHELAMLRKITWLDSHTDYLTLVHFKALKLILGDQFRSPILYRVSVANVEDFPHLGNPDYILKQHDDQLNRDIVHLKTVCWLCFKHTFRGIARGQYQVSLRMRATRHLNWPYFHSVRPGSLEINLSIPGDKANQSRVLVSQHIEAEWWDKIAKRRFDATRHLSSARLHFDAGTNWFTITLQTFTVSVNDAEIQFVFKDVDNPFWKGGLEWDFLEIKRIE